MNLSEREDFIMNESLKRIANDEIDKKADLLINVSDSIWEYAEMSLLEYKSAALYKKVLADEGFTVEENVCGLPTAFSGKFGEGRPCIGILAEYDALSGLSQAGGVTERKELQKGGSGHGCGHNMLGAGALGAAIGIKKYLEESKHSGTVILFGTPGEEGGAGKALMAKFGLWYSLDAALTWHPSDVNQVTTGSCNSSIQTLYKFKGVASHAAGNPEHGRSALDAVELMNIGVQFLREHMSSDARVHYALIDGGGFSPNVVQPTASVLYMVRSELSRDAKKLSERVTNIAKGAALMTDTEFEEIFIDASSNTVSNHALEALAYENFKFAGLPEYTDEEWEFARQLFDTYPKTGTLPSLAAEYDDSAKVTVASLTEDGSRAINDFLAPLYKGRAFSAGSTDVGDVSWQTPALQINTVTFPSGAPGHSWQNVSCGKTSIGHKGLICAAKVIADTGIDLFESPEKLSEIREEFNTAVKSGYVCPIPDEVTTLVPI